MILRIIRNSHRAYFFAGISNRNFVRLRILELFLPILWVEFSILKCSKAGVQKPYPSQEHFWDLALPKFHGHFDGAPALLNVRFQFLLLDQYGNKKEVGSSSSTLPPNVSRGVCGLGQLRHYPHWAGLGLSGRNIYAPPGPAHPLTIENPN